MNCILEINPLLVTSFTNVFSQSVGCFFILLMISSTVQKIYILIRSHLFLFLFLLPLKMGPKIISLWLMSKCILPMFSSKSFIVSGLTFRSLIYFEFIFVYGVQEYSNFIFFFTCSCQVFPAPLIEETLFSIVYPCLLCHKLTISVGVSGLSFLFLWPIFLCFCIFLCQYYSISEKAMAPHSSTLAWEIPWMEEPGRLQSMGSHRVGHGWSNLAAAAAL